MIEVSHDGQSVLLLAAQCLLTYLLQFLKEAKLYKPLMNFGASFSNEKNIFAAKLNSDKEQIDAESASRMIYEVNQYFIDQTKKDIEGDFKKAIESKRDQFKKQQIIYKLEKQIQEISRLPKE